MNRRRDARKDDAMNDLSHLGLGGQDKLKDDEDYAERMGVLTPLPLTDAALRERLTTATDICNVKHGTGDYDDVQICEDCILAFGIALREAAREEEAAQSREALAVMGANYDEAVDEAKRARAEQREADATRLEARVRAVLDMKRLPEKFHFPHLDVVAGMFAEEAGAIRRGEK